MTEYVRLAWRSKLGRVMVTRSPNQRFPVKFKKPMHVYDTVHNAAVKTTAEALSLDLVLGKVSPSSLVRDVGLDGLRPWQPACTHPLLRPNHLGRQCLPGVLAQIVWRAPDGQACQAPSREAFVAALHARYATADTCVVLHSSEGCFRAYAHELLLYEQRSAWPPGMTALALVAGVAATGVAYCAVQHYQRCHTPVRLSDPALRAELYERDGGLCGLCDTPVRGNDFHLDHRHPRVRGGEDTRANLHVTHPICNLRKGALTVNEYLAR